MKEGLFKGILTTILGGLSIYFNEMAIPIIILITVMIIDYITGLTQGLVSNTLSSRTGIIGIIKKTCYLAVVAVAICVDWILQSALLKIGVDFGITYTIGIVVVIWLIINELISTLENVAEIGVPMPPFLMKFINKLKIITEQNKDGE